MAIKKLSRMSCKGDEAVAEWDTETVTPEALAAIEAEFNQLVKDRYFAADLDKKELIREFDSEANMILIPRMQGGCA